MRKLKSLNLKEKLAFVLCLTFIVLAGVYSASELSESFTACKTTQNDPSAAPGTKNIYAALDQLPGSLLNEFYGNGWKIVTWKDTDTFMAAHGFAPSNDYQSFFENENHHISGITNSAEKTLYIKISEESDSTIYATTIHEMGHYIDRANGNLAYSYPFTLCRYKYKEYISYSNSLTGSRAAYCDINAREYFAVTFTDYFLHYEYVAENYPALAHYYDHFVMSKYE